MYHLDSKMVLAAESDNCRESSSEMVVSGLCLISRAGCRPSEENPEAHPGIASEFVTSAG